MADYRRHSLYGRLFYRINYFVVGHQLLAAKAQVGIKTFPRGIYVVQSITGKGFHLILRSLQITVISQILHTRLQLYLRTVTVPSSQVIVADLIISSSLVF